MRFAPKLAFCALFVIAIVGASASRAEDYPTHPVRIIIGFGAGASADTPARLLAQKFTDALGQQFLVENKPGAGSNVAAEYVARAPNDGYTIFMATAAQTNYAGMTINPDLRRGQGFCADRPRRHGADDLVANPSLGVSNLQRADRARQEQAGPDFLRLVGRRHHDPRRRRIDQHDGGNQARPRALSGQRAGVDRVVTGRVQLWFAPASAVIQQVDEGKLMAIAVTTAHAPASRPTCRPWRKPACPATTSACGSACWRRPARRSRSSTGSHKIANDALKSPDVVEPLRKIGMETVGGTPEEFARYIDGEVKKATEVAIAANIRQ